MTIKYSDVCGEHEVSYTYFVPQLDGSVRVVVTDEGEDHLKKDKYGYYEDTEDLGADISFSVRYPNDANYISGAGAGTCVDPHNGYEELNWPVYWQILDQDGAPFACAGILIDESVRHEWETEWSKDWPLGYTDENGEVSDLLQYNSPICFAVMPAHHTYKRLKCKGRVLAEFDEFYNPTGCCQVILTITQTR